jgi:hypothetical protein
MILARLDHQGLRAALSAWPVADVWFSSTLHVFERVLETYPDPCVSRSAADASVRYPEECDDLMRLVQLRDTAGYIMHFVDVLKRLRRDVGFDVRAAGEFMFVSSLTLCPVYFDGPEGHREFGAMASVLGFSYRAREMSLLYLEGLTFTNAEEERRGRVGIAVRPGMSRPYARFTVSPSAQSAPPRKVRSTLSTLSTSDERRQKQPQLSPALCRSVELIIEELLVEFDLCDR